MKPVFLLSSVFPKTHKCTFTTFYFTFSYSSSNSLQFDIYFIRVIFQTHKVMYTVRLIQAKSVEGIDNLAIDYTVSKSERLRVVTGTDA